MDKDRKEKDSKKYLNKYETVIIASKRALQLLKGAKPLLQTEYKKAISVSLIETEKGKIVPLNSQNKSEEK
jgi:DNA-directed RNA polymerase omega subunit